MPAGFAHAASANVAADAHINAAAPGSNFGAAININVGSGNTGLIQFDLSSLPSGLSSGQISKATLTFFVNRVASPGALDIAPVTSPWTEAAVTSANRPVYLPPSAVSIPVTAAGFVTVEITQIVKDWATGGLQNFGVQISPAISSPSTVVMLDSKENTATSHPAFLDVTLVAIGPAGATGAPGATGAKGATGSIGATGPTGTTGAVGPTGAAGAAGTAGAKGATGATGSAGPAGPTGATGPAGPAAVMGSVTAVGAAQVGTHYTVTRTGVGAYHLVIANGTIGSSTLSLIVTPIGATLSGLFGSTGAGGIDVNIQLSGDAPWTFLAAPAL